jgi:hypothetical protein
MRGTFDFDPAQCDYGPATSGVRQILSEWLAVDWFVPPRSDPAGALAVLLFEEHNTRARAHLPELFPQRVQVRAIVGNWTEFATLAQTVRTPSSWDWKFSALKKLSRHHSAARGWSMQEEAKRCVALDDGGQMRPGDLFIRIGGSVIWSALCCPRLDWTTALAPSSRDVAGWYLSYAQMDVIECIEWQLAERSERLETNPFVPLLRCYAAGFYPFSVRQNEVVLFAFEPDRSRREKPSAS